MIFPAIRLESPSRVVERKKYFERWISDAVMIDNVLIMSVPKSGLESEPPARLLAVWSGMTAVGASDQKASRL